MNDVILSGRLTRDPEYKKDSEVAKATIAVDRQVGKDQEKKTDFIPLTAFKTKAALMAKYLYKGSRLLVNGSIRTGSYKNKEGNTIYTTEVIVNRVEFLDTKKEADEHRSNSQNSSNADNDFNNSFDNGKNDPEIDEMVDDIFQGQQNDRGVFITPLFFLILGKE